MEHDSPSNRKGRKKNCECAAGDVITSVIVENGGCAERDSAPDSRPRWTCEKNVSAQFRASTPTDRSLSAQVMEYYRKYSQNSSLGRYFSLTESGFPSDVGNCYRRMYESIPETVVDGRERYSTLAADDRSPMDSFTPRERRRWARPPLIGQPSTCETSGHGNYGGATTDSRTPSPICKRPTTETIPEERTESSRENLVLAKDADGKAISPTSSVASHKPLEWDSGADVGYYNAQPLVKDNGKKLCTIERMALARGCSAAMRLDPEGTNESTGSATNVGDSRTALTRTSMKPDANSTPLVGMPNRESGESESEIEITPIVKNHTGCVTREREGAENEGGCRPDDGGPKKNEETPRRPEITDVRTKLSTGGSKNSKETTEQTSAMKKSASMNLLVFPLSKLSLERSKSELNLRVGDKKNAHPLPPLIFDSTSSIATVVNKPATCDKFVQTNRDASCGRESVGIQVSVTDTSDESANDDNHRDLRKTERSDNDEEKPPLPKRASSLATKYLHSILKNSTDTYKIRDEIGKTRETAPTEDRRAKKLPETSEKSEIIDDENSTTGNGSTKIVDRRKINGTATTSTDSSDPSKTDRSTGSSRRTAGREDATLENPTGRASDSFEYFPGHVYQNVRNDCASRVSSVDTGRESRCSTMPNTSSSIDEKLWGDSDSLVRDLERSVCILKSLVDANKCDKQVKKRLIHHVIKRLVTAKYTDDRIDRDLEDNVPWNPADARNKVYRNEIIQALANKNNTTDSSADDWLPSRKNGRPTTASPKKLMTSKDARSAKDIIELAAGSARTTPNTDEFPFDRHTDGTVMDGRKARMGLRSEDRRRDVVNDERDRSESSECFLPQSRIAKKPIYTLKTANVFYTMNDVESREKSGRRESPTIGGDAEVAVGTTTVGETSASSRDDECPRNCSDDGILLVKERRRIRNDETDWRLPTTMSERRFEMGRCANSQSGDAKLIDYAEMEKKNQLVWITNEISHLCNLKRLLQEPHKFGERRRDASSPGKRVDRWTTRPRSSSRGGNERSRERETEDSRDDRPVSQNESVSKNFDRQGQWSSHGNLTSGRSANVVCQRITSKNRDGRARKLRNSCTQTGHDGVPSGHSKTGGEIISSTMTILPSSGIETRPERAYGVREASVQTVAVSPRTSSTMESDGSSTRRTRPNNVEEKIRGEESSKHVCYCHRYAAHSRHSACIVDSARRCARAHAKHCSYRARDDGPMIIASTNSRTVDDSRDVGSNSRSNDFRKEAKNKLNANCKSKYAIREIPVKARARCADCELHDEILSGARVADDAESAATRRGEGGEVGGDLKICACSMECDCEIGGGRKIGSAGVNEKRVEENERLTSCSETNGETANGICRCGERFVRPRGCGRCDCETVERPLAGVKETERRTKLSSRPDERNHAENTRKSCRTCGTVWSVREGTNAERKCSCAQDYLKPVAYELKFDENSVGTRKNDGVAKIAKIGGKGLITTEIVQTKVNETPPSSARSRGKCGCDEDGEKNIVGNEVDENHRPGTLKDFLATNRPEFLDNVETRRRYMSEISQLRQLKKEKRKQFLAMAGTSAFASPKKSTKATTTSAQKKVSENDMKLRLRMRYLRLNEVRTKRRQREKEEEARRNHLMAKLFGRKLQEKVLKGQVDLSQSVSVISNL